jgi:hypothetical protein
MATIGRRGFLGAVAGLVVAVATPLGRAFASTAAGPSGATAIVPLFFADPAAAGRIGTAYLAVAPQDGDVNLLLEALTPESEVAAEWWASLTVEELREHVKTASHADFAAGDVVDVAGWQLAVTEARLTALSTLL